MSTEGTSKEVTLEKVNTDKVSVLITEIEKVLIMEVKSMKGKKKLSKKKKKNQGQNVKKNVETREVMVAKVAQHDLEECKSLKKEVETRKDEENENFKELLKTLERFKVKMLIWEMFEESPCCIQFIQDILKLEKKPSDEEFIDLTKKMVCCLQNVG